MKDYLIHSPPGNTTVVTRYFSPNAKKNANKSFNQTLPRPKMKDYLINTPPGNTTVVTRWVFFPPNAKKNANKSFNLTSRQK